MGGQLSKKTENGGSSHSRPPTIDQIHPDLSSYEDACRRDPDLRLFDSNLQRRTTHVISTLAPDVAGGSGEIQSTLSLNSLQEVTGFLLETNRDVANVILEYKDDIWKNTDMFDLVEEFFDCSLVTLDFCTEMEKCLRRARDSQLIVQLAIQQFGSESVNEIGLDTKRYNRTLEELHKFSSVGDPFTGEFFALFQSVYNKQIQMFKRLQKKKASLDKKLKSLKSWRKISTVIFVATFLAVLICSVVAAAVSAPPVVTALAAAAAVPLGSMGKWLDSVWKKYLNEVRGQRDVIKSMQIGTCIAIKDLDAIRVLINRLKGEMETLVKIAEFGTNEGDEDDEQGVLMAMETIKKEMDKFMKSIEDVSKYADNISREVTMARTVIVRRIIGQANSNQ
ncbi:UPF0496 protein 1-like [Impatiens glandulifera]|uniref:UPF0496 protein 1-like n=1 Tax=Impatiens glandulifera TaxID=253017 RepID=UPI001FB079C3|nr:UPF0496 protein 1-like [Impatiens glandulifera]